MGFEESVKSEGKEVGILGHELAQVFVNEKLCIRGQISVFLFNFSTSYGGGKSF